MAIGAVIGGIGLAYSIYANRQAAIQQNKAARAQRRLNAIQEARKRRSQIREAQAQQGSIEAMGAAQGGVGSSNMIAAQSSLASQLSTNLNFLSNTTSVSNRATNALSAAADIRSKGALASSIGNFALQNSAGIDNLFSSTPATPAPTT